MTYKHTAGPWRVYVLADDSETYGNIAGMPIVTADDGNSEVCGACLNPADAQLIAAAPELLAVVKSILAMIDYCPDAKWFPDFDGVAFSRDSDAWKNAEAAIAKAEGRQ